MAIRSAGESSRAVASDMTACQNDLKYRVGNLCTLTSFYIRHQRRDRLWQSVRFYHVLDEVGWE
jgi:hypothetical protein